MKNLIIICSLIMLFPIFGWSQSQNANDANKNLEFARKEKVVANLKNLYDDKLIYLTDIKKFNLPENLILTTATSNFTETELITEFQILFNPENFKCGYDEKLKKKLKKLKNDSGQEGFVPSIITQKIENQKVYKLSNQGSNILVNSFKYGVKGKSSDLIYASYSPTSLNFNEEDYLEKAPKGYSNFFYSLDCSGYLSTALAASGGIDSASLKTAASSSSNSNNSLIVIAGVINSPLYQAYQARGVFASSSKESLSLRKEVLVQIISSIPNTDRLDDTLIFLDSNFKVVLTSNSGKSSFNGEASLSANGNFGFGFGNVSANGSATGKINRSSEFSDYNTYLLERNVNQKPDKITVLDMKNIISTIEKEIVKLNNP
ncbi:MAG: hypothetical protein H7339_17235 [Arcicella sp.]|nr:hypothetical protein [Arcicella sp.]